MTDFNDRRGTNPYGKTKVDHASLDAAWHESFSALKDAGLEHDADHPIAAQYRAASDAVNHSNRRREAKELTERHGSAST